MKKILAVALAVALILTTIMPTVAFAAVDYSYIRVRLDSMQKPASIQFKLKGAYRIAESSGVDLYPGIAYTLKTYGSGMRLTYKNGKGTVNVSLPSKVTFVQYSNGSGSNFFYLKNTTSGWRHYDGNMAFRRVKTSSSDYIEAVNTVFIETYLYGVVSSEMANDWPAEALKAQAVCARTYAMSYVKSRQGSSMNYDVVDTTSNQVYKGYPFTSSGAAQTNVINAVNATRGKVILVGDSSFADGMYSASNGGQVRTITMRYGSGTNTYHVFKEDPYDRNNSASPKFVFVFPKTTAALNALGTTDHDKADTAIDLIKDKVVAALAAKGVTCAKSNITVNAIKGVTPASLKPGMPDGSREFTEVSVTVNVTLAGVTLPAPVVAVTGNGAAIASGSTTPSAANGTDFGGASVAGATVQKTYTITNTGNAALTISGITVAGNEASDFTVGSLSSSTVAAGGTATFTVTFDPSASGERITTVSVASDAAASPYQFRIKGTGQSNGNAITAFCFKTFESYLGTISGSDITVHLPMGTDVEHLTAVFIADAGATAYVGSTAQTSGTTENSFATPVTYTVTAEDGTSHQYAVTVIADSPAPAPAAGGAMPEGTAEPEGTAAPEAGGGGMPAGTTMDITVTLKYISKASDGHWDSLGELRTKFASYSTLLGGTNLWLLYASSDSNCYYITARGYGHGIGLSQRGAQQMANESKTYLEILDFYFNMSASKSTLSTISVTKKALSQIRGKGSSASYAKVNASKLQLRAAASSKGTVIYTFTRNTIVEVLSTSKGWSRVLYGSKGLVGYVSAKYLKKTKQTPPPATAATATPSPLATASATTTATASSTPTPTAPRLMGRVVVSALYIRASASTSASIVYDHLVTGDSVVILDQNAAANWYKVKYASYTGYAMYQSGGSPYIEIIGTAPTATPAPTATAGSTVLTAVTAKANVTNYLTIRSSASTSASKVGEIPANASFTVLQVATTANWLKVKYSGKTGYVLAKYAIIGGNSAYRACTVTASTLNARSGAGTSYGIVTTLDSGDTLVVTATTTVSSVKWYKVKVGSTTAYVDSRYVRINTTT